MFLLCGRYFDRTPWRRRKLCSDCLLSLLPADQIPVQNELKSYSISFWGISLSEICCCLWELNPICCDEMKGCSFLQIICFLFIHGFENELLLRWDFNFHKAVLEWNRKIPIFPLPVPPLISVFLYPPYDDDSAGDPKYLLLEIFPITRDTAFVWNSWNRNFFKDVLYIDFI